MRVPSNGFDTIDRDAPTIGAVRGEGRRPRPLGFFCPHCRTINDHEPAEGHREAHCTNPASPYQRTGYNPISNVPMRMRAVV
jgi:hypothetical protein